MLGAGQKTCYLQECGRTAALVPARVVDIVVVHHGACDSGNSYPLGSPDG